MIVCFGPRLSALVCHHALTKPTFCMNKIFVSIQEEVVQERRRKQWENCMYYYLQFNLNDLLIMATAVRVPLSMMARMMVTRMTMLKIGTICLKFWQCHGIVLALR